MNKSAVQQILQDASEVVEGSGVEKDLRSIAFDKAVDLLAGPATAGPTNDGGNGGPGKGVDPVGDKAQATAKKMHIDSQKLAYVYEFEDDDVSLIVKRSALPSGDAGATQNVALLYAAARQAGGYDETHTKASLIRSRVENMGVLDKGNFATHLTEKKDWFTHKGKGASREFKVTTPGYEEAGRLIVQITGGEK